MTNACTDIGARGVRTNAANLITEKGVDYE